MIETGRMKTIDPRIRKRNSACTGEMFSNSKCSTLPQSRFPDAWL